MMIRRGIIALNAIGIAGMIVTSIMDRHDGALTFGLITAVGSLCLLVASTVAPISGVAAPLGDPETLAEAIDADIEALTGTTTTGDQLRDLVRQAVRLGRALGPPP